MQGQTVISCLKNYDIHVSSLGCKIRNTILDCERILKKYLVPIEGRSNYFNLALECKKVANILIESYKKYLLPINLKFNKVSLEAKPLFELVNKGSLMFILYYECWQQKNVLQYKANLNELWHSDVIPWKIGN